MSKQLILSARERLDIMSRIQHPESYYKQAFNSKGIDITQMTHAEISVGIAAMKAIEADSLIWAAENIPGTSEKEIEKAVDSLIKKGW